MVHPLKKYLEDLKKRINDQPRSVTYKMLVRAIAAEIQSKSMPQFMKNEICKSMFQVREFVEENDWARKPTTGNLMRLYQAVVDVKPNHEGYVRVEYGYFREALEDLRERIAPPQLIEIPSDIKAKIDQIRVCGSPRPVLYCEEHLNFAQCIEKRRTVLDYPSIQHYRAAGIRIFGSVSQDIDVPQIVAEAKSIQKLIQEMRQYIEDNKDIKSNPVCVALATAEELLQQDAIWFINCTKIRKSLGNMLQALKIRDGNAKKTVYHEVKSLLDSTIPYVRRFDDWMKAEEINKEKLKAGACCNHLTPDEMLMQVKRLRYKVPDDCP